ncbi:MAG: methionyl-tRNA formyltransferase [Opitutaceae bacterium]|nr:methionyl-tRNA formyltransferase [Opitutaceae bacterium]
MGSDPIALPLLEWLIGDEGRKQIELVSIYTQPDRAVGRGQRVVPNAIKTWTIAHGIDLHQPAKLTADVQEALAGMNPDISLVMAYGHILRDAFIETPRFGTLNLHASILPKYRGASPIQSAILSGDSKTGISLMRIVRELDAGPVADVEEVSIEKWDTALEIETKLAGACVPLVARNLSALAEGTLKFVEQSHADATFCRKLTKSDGALDFTDSAEVLAARINGLHPWPGCRINIAEQSVRIALAESGTGEGEPGVVIGQDEAALIVGTGNGFLRLLQLQRPGGRMLPAAEFLRGFPVATGTKLPASDMPVLIKSSN